MKLFGFILLFLAALVASRAVIHPDLENGLIQASDGHFSFHYKSAL